MKKLLLFTLLFCASAASFAQSEDNPADAMKTPATGGYKNEFGVDATAFIRQFFNSGQSYGYSNPEYYLTYRRYFKPGNLRFAIGGAFANQEQPMSVPNNPDATYNSYSYQVDFRLGWEFKNELSKRWQVFYGLDVRPSFTHSKNDGNYYNNGYANGYESRSTSVGLAPVLGFRYRITSRLSLMTEGTFSINYQTSSTRQYFTPVSNQYPAMPDVTQPKSKRTSTTFYEPVSLIVAFDI